MRPVVRSARGVLSTNVVLSAGKDLLLFGAIALAACSTNKGTQVKASGATFVDSADQVFYGVMAPLETGGVKRGTLFADTMYVMNDQTRFDCLNARIEFNTTTGVPDGNMRADRCRYDRRRQVLEGWGNVIVRSVDGKQLKSPHVVYDQLQDRIWSDTTFEFIEADRVTTGHGFQTNSTLTRQRCDSLCNVRAKVNIPR